MKNTFKFRKQAQKKLYREVNSQQHHLATCPRQSMKRMMMTLVDIGWSLNAVSYPSAEHEKQGVNIFVASAHVCPGEK
jgi:hypothetical protein